MPASLWKLRDMQLVMEACLILHNIIVEDERDVEGLDCNHDQSPASREVPEAVSANAPGTVSECIGRMNEIMDSDKHLGLQKALVDYQWELKGIKFCSSIHFYFRKKSALNEKKNHQIFAQSSA